MEKKMNKKNTVPLLTTENRWSGYPSQKDVEYFRVSGKIISDMNDIGDDASGFHTCIERKLGNGSRIYCYTLSVRPEKTVSPEFAMDFPKQSAKKTVCDPLCVSFVTREPVDLSRGDVIQMKGYEKTFTGKDGAKKSSFTAYYLDKVLSADRKIEEHDEIFVTEMSR